MAHDESVRRRVRAGYVFDGLPLDRAASRCGVPTATARRWRAASRVAGDDWDKMRTAAWLAGDGVETTTRQMLTDYVAAHRTLMRDIQRGDVLPAQKASMLASLADSFNKTVAASKKVMPETSELATALEVLSALGEFVRDRYPQHATALLEVLEPFGADVVATRFGKGG